MLTCSSSGKTSTLSVLTHSEASLKLFAATCVCFKERSSLLRHSNTFMRERQSFSCKRSLAMSELIRALSLSSLLIRYTPRWRE